MTKKQKPTDDLIASDLIIGGPRIADAMGIPYRQLSYLVATGRLGDAITKLGPKKLVASRSKLRAVLGLTEKPASAA
jgi:hypothetical protein